MSSPRDKQAPTASAGASAGSTPASSTVAVRTPSGPALSGPARRLAEEAGRAAQVRALSTDPDVVALRIERVRVQVDRLAWSGIVLGLAFTMTNVQAFAAAGAAAWSTTWWAAWALDPMVSLVLIAVLRAEQVTARWQVRTGPWVRRARWTTLVATYVMNTWSAWASGSPSQVVLHSVPPLVVFVAAEAVTGLREALTQAVHAAAQRPTPSGGERTGSTAEFAPVGASAGSTAAPAGVAEDAAIAAADVADLDATATTDEDGGPDAASAGSTPAAVPAGQGLDGRVVELAELLTAGNPVTSAQAGVLHGVSARQGRRLLAAAQIAVTSGVDRTATHEERADGSPAATSPALAPAGWSS